MEKFVTLLGTEEVSRAGSNMKQAAQNFGEHVSNMNYSMDRNQQFMDDWLRRFEQILEEDRKARGQV